MLTTEQELLAEEHDQKNSFKSSKIPQCFFVKQHSLKEASFRVLVASILACGSHDQQVSKVQKSIFVQARQLKWFVQDMLFDLCGIWWSLALSQSPA